MGIIYTQGTADVTVAAAGSIAVYTADKANVYQLVGYPNFPQTKTLLGVVTASQTVFGPFASGAQITIEGNAANTFYVTGVAPTNPQAAMQFQPTPGVLNATGALTAAMMLSGIVTSTTAAAVAGTVPIGSVMDAASQFAVNNYFDWTVIATGANAFTVTADTNHTLVGSGVVAAGASGRFRTRKTATATFVTYRIGG